MLSSGRREWSYRSLFGKIIRELPDSRLELERSVISGSTAQTFAKVLRILSLNFLESSWLISDNHVAFIVKATCNLIYNTGLDHVEIHCKAPCEKAQGRCMA
jgi:hypothetical protein